MKEFLTARDVEDLAARGVKQIPIDEHLVLTDVAKETAAALGITFVNVAGTPPAPDPSGSASAQQSSPLVANAGTPASLGAKPKGCLHSHTEDDPNTASSAAGVTASRPSASDSVVDRLVEAMRRLNPR